MSFTRHQQQLEASARRREADRLPHRRALASARLKPLDWAARLKIRRQDIPVFEAAACGFDHTIIVRATNLESLDYIGRKGYCPKPMDCKPKTADGPAYVSSLDLRVQCAGLVVDPSLIGYGAYRDDKKRADAQGAWKSFLKDKTREEIERKVFRRRGSTSGYFAVDLHERSPHYGCLMLSESSLPDGALDSRVPRWQAIKPGAMAYIHGDYDLYGLLDMEKTSVALARSGGREGFERVVIKGELYGMPHYYTESFPAIQEFLNRGIGAPMIQHGSQDNVAHQGDQLYVFDPIGGKYFVDAGAEAVRDIYELVFAQAR